MLTEDTIDELFYLYTRPQFYVYMPLVFITIGVMLFAINAVERIQRNFGVNSAQYRTVAKFHRFSYAAISGIIGAQSILFAKTT